MDGPTLISLTLWLGLACIPAFIARSKRRSFLGWFVYGAILFIVAIPHALLIKPRQNAEDHFVCSRCHSRFSDPRGYMAGSFGVELFLWLLFILPGLIYSIWRLTTKSQICPQCSSREFIPLNTPEGRRLTALTQ